MQCPIIAPPKKKKKIKNLHFFLAQNVYLLINNISGNFRYSKIIRKVSNNCPSCYFSSVQHCPMDSINPFISVNHVPMEVGTRRFKKCNKKKYLKCVLGPK